LPQGIEPDDSDNEWDSYIQRQYGEIAVQRPQPQRDPGAAHVDLENMIQQTFGMWDEIANAVDEAENARVGAPEEPAENDGYDGVDDTEIPWGDPDDLHQSASAEYDRLREAARIPLYQGSAMTTMEATTILLNILREGGVSNVVISEVFAELHCAILPQPNTLPDNEYEASDVLRRLGLSFQSIHACPNGCVLFRGVHKDAMVCPDCRSMRMVRRGSSMVPQRVLRYFPIIPRLKRMFRSPLQAAAMTWHARVDPRDKLVRHVSQGRAWAHVNTSPHFENFGDDPRNLRLGLTTDGINPFSEKRSVYSTWPVLLLNYNVPPWMTTKKFFVMLSLLIPGPRAVTGQNFDVYIAPLLEELLLL
jgi:hypothetical protein